MRIRTQLNVTMLLFGIILATIVISAVIINRQVEKAQDQKRLASSISRRASELSYLYSDYLIYGESQQLARWQSRFDSFSAELARFDAEIHSSQRQALLRNIQASSQLLKEVFHSVVVARENHTADPSIPLEAEFLQVSWSRLAVQAQRLTADASRLSELFHYQAERLIRLKIFVVYTIISVFGAFFIFHYILIQRRTLQSLATLQDGTAIIGSGNLEFTIEEKKNDEIGDLSRAFNWMAANLKDVTASKADLEREIADRERAEECIRLQARMLDAVGQGVVATDLDNKIIYWNRAATILFGWEREEVIGLDIMDVTVPQIARDQADQIIAALSQGKAWSGEFSVQRKDGTTLEVLVSDAPVLDEAGKFIGVIGVSLDISERKRTEDSLRQAQAAAEEANRAKSDFLANMSHEIRTPMTVFLAALEYLLQTDRDPERRHLLEMAEQSAQRLRALIDDILDLSRIEARRVDIEEDPFDLRACVRDAVEMMRIKAEEKNLGLLMNLSPQLPPLVLGDADRLGQVLINLLANAVKFTSEGEVSVSVRPRGETLEFAISDTGIGIPAEKQNLLFQSFSQVADSRTRKYGGTGLGLAISKGLVELMGGEVGMRSREGRGSVFFFTLPLKAAAESGSAPASTPYEDRLDAPDLRFAGARILVVEDEPLVREMILTALGMRGIRAETAETGGEAVRKWAEGDFNVVLMDLQMPGMDGLEATRRIREAELAGSKRIWIVGLTAHARGEIGETCLAAGMDRVLTKPVQMRDLFAALAGYLPEGVEEG